MQKSINKRKSTNPRTLLLISLLSIMCFLIIAFSRSLFDGTNLAVNSWAASIQTEGLTQAANIVAYCFDTTFLIAITLPIVGLLLYKEHTRNAALLVGVMGADALLLQLIKTFVVSPRPLNGLMIEEDYSFPSGHVTSTIVFFGMLTYLVWENRKSIRSKICLAVITPTLAVIVGFGRIYLNVHWLSDVLAAPFLALFVIATSILIMQYLTRWYNHRQTASASSDEPLGLRAATLCGRAITSTQQTYSGDIK